ncbi:MAG: contractile injection system protein, VgrG/Pvc8 family, partial [Geminicoccaceae bacterium]
MLEGERTVEIKVQGVQEWGDHLLQVDAAACGEHMSRPFTCTVSLLSDHGDDIAKQLPQMIGRHAILRVEVVEDLYRYFSGIITSFTQLGVDAQNTAYTMEMASWLWFLGHRRNHRIFQFESPQDILAKIFKEWLDDFRDQGLRVDDRAVGPFTVRD